MLSKKLAIDHIPQMIRGKRVLMRVDFNVPVKGNKIDDEARIRNTIPTIQYCLDNGAKSVVLMSHLGRPDGQRIDKYSMKPVVPALEDFLQKKVEFLNDCIGKEVENACLRADNGKVVLLENLRFHRAEEGSAKINGEKIKAPQEEVTSFRQSLSKLGDIYVNDAFGTAHRAHSSVVGIDVNVRAAGLLMKKELEYFARVLERPERPLTMILGGAKIRDKIPLIKTMLEISDQVIIGGGMSYTFNKVLKNMRIGQSLFDEEGSKIVNDIMNAANEKGVKIYIPIDYNTADKVDENANTKIVTVEQGVDDEWEGLDTGPETQKLFRDVILKSKTICWNGPHGMFELKPFSKGSLSVLDAVVAATEIGAVSVIGGGDTASLVNQVPGMAGKISHISTGGGAALELMEGKALPGIVALSDKQ